MVSQGVNSVKPVVPKSLVILVPAIFVLLPLVASSFLHSCVGSSFLQIATVVTFVVTVGAGFMFWRDLPDF